MSATRKTKTPSRHGRVKAAADQRILILDPDKAKPNSAAWNFLKKQAGKCGKDCIEVVERPNKGGVVTISEDLCAVCLTRAKQCPGGAVKIVRLPTSLATDTTHSHGSHAFRLHGLPMPRPGHVLGLLGSNGIGKSTAIDILAGRVKPNLGVCTEEEKPTWEEIVRYYRGSDLQNYLTSLMEDRLRCVMKPQLDAAKIVRYLGGNNKVKDVLCGREQRGNLDEATEKLELSHLLEREIRSLSGGELQRVTVCATIIQDADVYLFDEPSSFLDLKQRLAVADMIRGLVDPETYRIDADVIKARQVAASKYVIIVEHDLTILNFASDYVCCLYGESAAFGVVAKRSTASRGINQFLAGYLAAENVRFRAEELTFEVSVQDKQDGGRHASDDSNADYKKDDNIANETARGVDQQQSEHSYPAMTKTFSSDSDGASSSSSFTLTVEPGVFHSAEVIGLLGENGTGKSTFMEMLALHLEKANCISKEVDAKIAARKDVQDDSITQSARSLDSLGISYKRQHFGTRFSKFKGTVQQLLEKRFQHGLGDQLFRLLVMKPLSMDKLKDLPVRTLSGGELQRLAICVCLGTPAQIYLIDEPSANLDCEQRITVAKVIKRWVVSHLGKTAFVIEHDMMMAATLFDQVMLFKGSPGVECRATLAPNPMEGFNEYLMQLRITVRRDPENHRFRINKRGCRRDREQKASGNFFSLETADDL